MSHAVKIWFISVIDLTNDAPVGVRIVGTDRDGSVEPNPLDSAVEKGFSGLGFPASGQAEINHLAIRINRTPQVAPVSNNTEIGLVHMPVDACTVQQGMSIRARDGASRAELEAVAQGAMAAWDGLTGART